MIKITILCDYCEADLTEERHPIVIEGKIHYCNSVCKESNQKDCEHTNIFKDDVNGECFDCGIVYADPNL